MTVQERVKPAGNLQAGSRVAQHGFDELRALPDAQPLQDLQTRLGGAALENSRDLVFRNTFKDIEFVLRTLGGSERALSSSATTPPISTT